MDDDANVDRNAGFLNSTAPETLLENLSLIQKRAKKETFTKIFNWERVDETTGYICDAHAKNNFVYSFVPPGSRNATMAEINRFCLRILTEFRPDIHDRENFLSPIRDANKNIIGYQWPRTKSINSVSGDTGWRQRRDHIGVDLEDKLRGIQNSLKTGKKQIGPKLGAMFLAARVYALRHVIVLTEIFDKIPEDYVLDFHQDDKEPIEESDSTKNINLRVPANYLNIENLIDRLKAASDKASFSLEIKIDLHTARKILTETDSTAATMSEDGVITYLTERLSADHRTAKPKKEKK